jgi:hypothetical protein
MFSWADLLPLLKKHKSGDWGDIHPEDRGLNEQALVDGTRILSVYALAEGTEVSGGVLEDDTTIWIITEADRSSTTILYPEEY